MFVSALKRSISLVGVIMISGWLVEPIAMGQTTPVFGGNLPIINPVTQVTVTQDGVTAQPVAVKQPTVDPLDPSTPRGSLADFQKYARNGRYDDAALYLSESSWISEEEKREVTRQFITMLDVYSSIDLSKVSGDPMGSKDDGLRPGVDRIGLVEISHAEVPLFMVRIDRMGGAYWRFTKSSVDRVVELYQDQKLSGMLEKLPRPLIEVRFFSVYLWQWILLLIFLTVSYLVAWGIVPILSNIGRKIFRLFKSHSWQKPDYAARIVDEVIRHSRSLLMVLFFYFSTTTMMLALRVERMIQSMTFAFLVIIITEILFRVIDSSTEWITERMQYQENKSLQSMVPLLRRGMKIGAGTVALLLLMVGFGVNVSAVIAGLGIGGLAIALAAQKTIENLFGGITLLLDKPIRVGDFCKFGTSVGTVEDVGIRSTRIRTLDRSIITVPNADFSQMQIENIGERDRIRMLHSLSLRYETSGETMRKILASIKQMLIDHPMVDNDPARVRFVKLGASSMDVELYLYVLTSDWDIFLGVQEDLLLRIIDIVHAEGSSLAFPSQMLYCEKDHRIG